MKFVDKFFIANNHVEKLQFLQQRNQFFILGLITFVALSLFLEKILIAQLIQQEHHYHQSCQQALFFETFAFLIFNIIYCTFYIANFKVKSSEYFLMEFYDNPFLIIGFFGVEFLVVIFGIWMLQKSCGIQTFVIAQQLIRLMLSLFYGMVVFKNMKVFLQQKVMSQKIAEVDLKEYEEDKREFEKITMNFF